MQSKLEDLVMCERRTYKNPPIEEALCEFRFQPNQDWDLTIPGKLHVKLADEYSGKPREQKVMDFTLKAQQGQPPHWGYGEGLAKVQFTTRNGKRMVAIGRDVLSVHMLRPYQDSQNCHASGWDEFHPRLEKALKAYWEVVQPLGVCRVGVRYINKIVIPGSEVNVMNYLKCALPIVHGLPNHLNNFMTRVEYSYADDVRLVLSQGTVQAPPNQAGLLLDIDLIWETQNSISLQSALEKASDLRDREREAFENLITDKARKLFDAD